MAKATKTEAHYRPRPNKGEKCAGCSMFRPSNGCTAVGGKVVPTGWCSYFEDEEAHFEDGGEVGGDTSTPGQPMDIQPPPQESDVTPGNKIPSMRDAYAEWQKNFEGLAEPLHTEWDPEQGPKTANLLPKADKLNNTRARIQPGADVEAYYDKGGRVAEDWEHIEDHPEQYLEDGGEVDDDEEDEAPQHTASEEDENEGPHDEVPHEPDHTGPPPQEEELPRQRRLKFAAASRQDSPRYDDGEPERLPETHLAEREQEPPEQQKPEQKPVEPEEATRGGAFLRTLGRAATATALTLPEIAAGSEAGAAVGGGIGTVILPGPGTAVGGFVGGLAGGIAGGLWGGKYMESARDWVFDQLGIDSPEKRAGDQLALSDSPGLRIGAEIAGSGPLFFKARGASLAQRLIGGGAMGALDVGQQYHEGGADNIDWREALARGAAGAVWANPNKLGKPLWDFGANRVPGAAARAEARTAAGRPNLDQPNAEQDIKDATTGASEDVKTSRGASQAQSPPAEDRTQPVATVGVVGDQGNTGRWAKTRQSVGIEAPERTYTPDVEAAASGALDESGGRPSPPKSSEEETGPNKQKNPFQQTNPDGSPQEFGQRKFQDIQSAEAHQGDDAIEAMQRRGTSPKETPELPEAPHPDEAIDAMQRAPGRAAEHPELPEGLPEGPDKRTQFGQHTPEQEDQYRRTDVGELPEGGGREQFGKRLPVPPSGHPVVDQLMQHPMVQAVLTGEAKPIRGYRVPYTAGSSTKMDGSFYVDNSVPDNAPVRRADQKGTVNLPIAKLFGIHEAVETAYIQERAKALGREPTQAEMQKLYAEGHKIARGVEEGIVRAAGGDIHDYGRLSERIDAEARKPLNPEEKTPSDLFKDPYAGDPKTQADLAAHQVPRAGVPNAAARLAAISRGRSAAPPPGTPPVGTVGGPPQVGAPIAGAAPGQNLGPAPRPQQSINQQVPPGGNAAGGRTPPPNRYLAPAPRRALTEKGMPWVATDWNKMLPKFLGLKEDSLARGVGRSALDRLHESTNWFGQMKNTVRRHFMNLATKDTGWLKDIADAWDRNDLAGLPKAQLDHWDRVWQPLVDATTQIRENIKNTWGENHLGTDTENGFMRVREDWQNMPEVEAIRSHDTILNEQTPLGQQFKTKLDKERDFAVLENQQGDRKVISIHKGTNGPKSSSGFTEWQGQKIAGRTNDPNFDRKVGSIYTDKNGEKWIVRDALMPEIEKHGLDESGKPIKYLRDPRISATLSFLQHLNLARDLQIVDDFKADPLFKALSTKPGEEPEPGMLAIDSPAFQGYHAKPGLANAINMYKRPGIRDDRLNGARKYARMLTQTLFYGPLNHVLNVVPHFVEKMGYQPLMPWTYPRNVLAATYAAKELGNPGVLMEKLMNSDATMMFQHRMASQLDNQLTKATQNAILANKPFFTQMATRIGMSPAAFLNATYRAAAKITWGAGDHMYLTALISDIMKQQSRTGLKFDPAKVTDDQIYKATNASNKYMPTYRLPPEQFGSNLLTGLQGDANVLMFGPYHHAILNGFANHLRDTWGQGSNWHTRVEAAGSMMALGVLSYYIWPNYFDKGVQWLTGNENATLGLGGPAKLLRAASEFAKGNAEEPTKILTDTIMPAKLAQTVWQAIQNKDWKHENILEPAHVRDLLDGDIRALPKLTGEELAHLVGAIAPAGAIQKNYAQDRSFWEAVRNELLVIREKSDKSVNWQQKQVGKDRTAAMRRENPEKNKNLIEQFFNWIGSLGE